MLPRPELPQYELTLPFSRKVVKYRPYTVKEEKILMLAATSDKPEELIRAAHQILKICADVDASKIAPIDLEYLFLKLRCVSVGETVDIVLNTDCEKEECSKEHKLGINLSNVEIKNLEYLENNFTKNNSGWIIPMGSGIGIVINPVDNHKNLEDEEYLYECMHSVYKDDEVTFKDEITLEEFINWLDMFTKKDKSRIEDFFDNTPYTYYKLEHVCRTCGKDYSVELMSIIDFLE